MDGLGSRSWVRLALVLVVAAAVASWLYLHQVPATIKGLEVSRLPASLAPYGDQTGGCHYNVAPGPHPEFTGTRTGTGFSVTTQPNLVVVLGASGSEGERYRLILDLEGSTQPGTYSQDRSSVARSGANSTNVGVAVLYVIDEGPRAASQWVSHGLVASVDSTDMGGRLVGSMIADLSSSGMGAGTGPDAWAVDSSWACS